MSTYQTPRRRNGPERIGNDLFESRRNAANVLNLHAREELAHGHAAPAITDAAAILGMSRHFMERPTFIAALVGIRVDAVGNKTLEQALPYVKNQNDLAGLNFENLQPLGRGFQQALRGEEAWGLSKFGTFAESTPFFGVFFLDLDDYLKLMKTCEIATPQPYYAIRGTCPGTQNRQNMNRIPHLNAGLVPSPAFETSTGPKQPTPAQSAVAMTRYRLDHGTLQAHLSDLVPTYLEAVPTDPFDGHPLRLAIKNNTWIIYSVGPNQVDDGGIPIVKGKGDVIFTLKPSP